MLVLLWATLLCAGRSNNANAIAPPVEEKHCENGICINLEITAEAGLCVVLPCYYDIDHFVLESADWYKCDLSKPNCTDSDVILHWNNTNPNAQSGSREWLSMLDLTQHNCSFIINDLSKSDNGSYQVRLHGILNGSRKGFTSARRTTITVEDLIQKPTVMIPPLTEGQQATLTCTAPGLFSGSEPDITWTWRGAGEKASHITGNITAFKNLTAVTQRHSSTLMFNPSAEHHGTEVTCKVTFTNSITTEETVTLNVTFFPRILSSSACEVQSEVLTCVCISEGFPLPTIKWPLLKNHAECSVTTSTTVSNHTVHSTATLTVKDHSNTVVECVSSNEVGEMRQNVTIITSESREAQHGPSAVLPWVVVAVVSLIVNVICIILLMLLWNTRKKVKPNQEERTYMSLQKTDPSPEYDVIAPRLN